MHSSRKLIYVFLASPGDLQDERRAIRDVATEFNTNWADSLGYQVELLGWEETVAGFGRPQDLINRDVDRCDLFIGMIWKRWGTPTTASGSYTSGFEEEFERSIARRKTTGLPEVSLLFKQIPESHLEDPGDDLKRVLEFKQTIVDGKELFYQEFEGVRDVERLANRCLTTCVNRLREEDAPSAIDEGSATPAGPTKKKEVPDGNQPQASPLSPEGFAFLTYLADTLGHKTALEDLSASDVARFRLLANSISKANNHEAIVGGHDINLLFHSHISGMNLGERELLCLSQLGFHHLPTENVPLWRWYASLSTPLSDVAILSSVAGYTEESKVGALNVLAALDRDISTADPGIDRKRIIDYWFSDNTSARVRCAALSYLAKRGVAADFVVAENEYTKNDQATLGSAIECMLSIRLRTGSPQSAQKLALTLPLESIAPALLEVVTGGFETLETAALRPGLAHANARVRLETLIVLVRRESIDTATAERFRSDGDAVVRREAIRALSKLGVSLTQDDIKRTLVQPQQQPGYSGKTSLALRDSDKKGQELFDQYLSDELRRLPDLDLTHIVNNSLMYDDEAYFVRTAEFPRKHAKELRQDVDDLFKNYFDTRTRRTMLALRIEPDHPLVKTYRDNEKHTRQLLARRGLDILCRYNNRNDLDRVRNNLRIGYAGVSTADAIYLRKNGEWEDIELLAGSLSYPSYPSILFTSRYDDLHDEISKAVVHMSGARSVSELFALALPEAILKRAIEWCSSSRFSRISKHTLLELFGHESADVRRAASIKAVLSFTRTRIRDILEEYAAIDKQRYYNVIHWLDLGASMSRAEAKRVARVRFR